MPGYTHQTNWVYIHGEQRNKGMLREFFIYLESFILKGEHSSAQENNQKIEYIEKQNTRQIFSFSPFLYTS